LATEKKTFTCKLCGREFDSGDGVIAHAIDHHKVTTNTWFHGKEFIDASE